MFGRRHATGPDPGSLLGWASPIVGMGLRYFGYDEEKKESLPQQMIRPWTTYGEQRKLAEAKNQKKYVKKSSFSLYQVPKSKQLNYNPSKNITSTSVTYTISTASSGNFLNGVAQGDDFTNRTGRRIVMKSLFIRGFFHLQPTVVYTNIMRVLVTYDKQSNGAGFNILDLLVEETVNSPLNLDGVDRFIVLCDKLYYLTPDVVGAQIPFKLYKKLSLKTTYSGTGGAITDIATGAIILTFIGNHTIGSGNYANATITNRIKFVD